MSITWRWCALPLAALALGASATAQTGPLDQPNAAELATYSAMLWQFKDTGTPDANAASFAFSDAAFNSPLFSPWRGALRKIQAAKGIDVGAPESCWGVTGSVTAEEIKSFMIEGKISTPIDHTAEIVAHLEALLAALGEGQDVAVSINDQKLVTVGLDPQTLVLVPIDTAPVPANAQVADLMSTVVIAAQQLAANQDLSAVVADPLLGNTPYWYPFIVNLDASLGSAAVTIDARVTGVEAAFGQYGSLVIAQVETNQGVYLLVDTVNGTVAGPYDNSQPYDARALLATHAEYVDGQTIEYFVKGDCAGTTITPTTKQPMPNPPVLPGTIPPGWTQRPVPPCLTGGCPSTWSCTFTVTNPGPPETGTCVCTSDYQYIPSGPGCPGSGWNPPMVLPPCVLYLKITCEGGTTQNPCGRGGCPDGNPNSTWPPPTTPGTTGPIAPGCATANPPCTEYWWYWG